MNIWNKPAPCGSGCCASVGSYIEQHLDPQGLIDGTEDASELVADLDKCYRDEGGSGISVEEMQEYLEDCRWREWATGLKPPPAPSGSLE